MSLPADINDRYVAAAVKAEGASEIIRRFANDPVGSFISTESGEVPSLAEWLVQNSAALGGIPALQAAIDALGDDLNNPSDMMKGVAKVGGAGRVIDSIAALRALPKEGSTRLFVTGYYSAFDGGGGHYSYDPTDTVSADNGGSIIVAADGGRWRLSYSGRVSVKVFGAKGNNVQDDQPFIQAALDAVKAVFVPGGTYKLGGSLEYKANGYSLHGENMNNAVLTSAGTYSLIRNPDAATTTRLFCEVKDIKLIATTIGAGKVLDWKSMQLGRLENVWVLGQSTAGCIAINLEAVWTVTECTYNRVEGCLIGLCATGIFVTDGANNNTIWANRIQPSLSGGAAILLSATAAGRVSSVTIGNNGFEYPGAISNGVTVLQNCTDIRVLHNRFESLNNAIIIGATGNARIFAPVLQNYFSSCTTNKNISAGSTSAIPEIFASVATATAASAVSVVGRAFNLTVSRTSAGVYVFTFVTQPNDAGYSVAAASSSERTQLTAKSAGSFTITTKDGAGVAVDSALLDVTISANR